LFIGRRKSVSYASTIGKPQKAAFSIANDDARKIDVSAARE
jgi:hypothetical protein